LTHVECKEAVRYKFEHTPQHIKCPYKILSSKLYFGDKIKKLLGHTQRKGIIVFV